jgi:hypothetical protein
MLARVRLFLRPENRPSPVVMAIVLNLILVFGIAGATTLGYNPKRLVTTVCRKIEAAAQSVRVPLQF